MLSCVSLLMAEQPKARSAEQRRQETRQATQNVPAVKGCRAEFSTLKPCSLVSVEACHGEVAVCQVCQVCQGGKVLSPERQLPYQEVTYDTYI